MRALIISAVGFYQDVAVNKRFPIARVGPDLYAVFAIDEIEISVPALDPVVADDETGRTVL